MSHEQPAEGSRPEWRIGARAIELATALLLFGCGVVVVGDSIRVGMGWAPDGPEAGFYPFYVGSTLCACSSWILVSNLRKGEGAPFVGRAALVRILAVFLPSVAYVAGLFGLGTYLASALFLVGFTLWQGRYPLRKALPIGLGVTFCLFLLFEVWLQVPLPKGPIEAWLGY